MLASVVWILAGITAWCVASLALALVVGPMVRKADRIERRNRVDDRPRTAAFVGPTTGAIALPYAS